MIFPSRRSPLLARGARTVLREFQREDVDRWCGWPPHEDRLFAGYDPPYLTTRQRDSYFRGKQADPRIRQYAVDDLDGELLGRISLRDIDWGQRTAVLGATFHPRRLDRGYGSEALAAFLRYFFDTLQMNALYLDVAAHNARARRVYEKLGFGEVGQRWGEAQPDDANVFGDPQLSELRPLFQRAYSVVRPLVIDMVLGRGEYQARPAAGRRDAGPAHPFGPHDARLGG